MWRKRLTGEEIVELCRKIYKKTSGYYCDKVIPGKNGKLIIIHSDAFLDEHPERKNNPEYTAEELG